MIEVINYSRNECHGLKTKNSCCKINTTMSLSIFLVYEKLAPNWGKFGHSKNLNDGQLPVDLFIFEFVINRDTSRVVQQNGSFTRRYLDDKSCLEMRDMCSKDKEKCSV